MYEGMSILNTHFHKDVVTNGGFTTIKDKRNEAKAFLINEVLDGKVRVAVPFKTKPNWDELINEDYRYHVLCTELRQIKHKYNYTFDIETSIVKDLTTNKQRKLGDLINLLIKEQLHLAWSRWMRNPSEQAFHSLIGEMLSAKALSSTNKVLVISCHLGDYVTMSGNTLDKANFTSCHDTDGCHRAGPYSYMVNAHHFLGYVCNKCEWELAKDDIEYIPYKKGRCNFFLFNVDGIDVPLIGTGITGKYGQFTALMAKTVREYIEHKLKVRYVKSNNLADKVISRTNGAYWDGLESLSHPCGTRPIVERAEMCLENSDPLCPTCGYVHGDNEQISCCIALGSYSVCCNCGCALDENDVYYSPDGDDHYCQSCWDDRFSHCERCGYAYDIDDVFNCDDSYYCPDCADRIGYVSCDRCGDMTRDYTITKDSEKYYCDGCAEYRVNYCSECGCLYEFASNWCNGCDKCTDCCDCEPEEDNEEEV